MIEKLHSVSIGEIKVSANPNDILLVYGLGSCVFVSLYDPVVKAGGILHALLPTARGSKESNPKKFVDQGIPLLIEAVLALGAKPKRLKVCLCGGSRIIVAPGFNDMLNVGKRNILTAKTILKANALEIHAQSVGGTRGRTVKLYIATGKVTVKTLGQRERTLLD